MWVGGKIGDMDDLACSRSSSCDRPISRPVAPLSNEGIGLGREPEASRRSINLSFPAKNHRLVRTTEAYRGCDERIENWLQIDGRTADDLQHIAGRGLVFERLFELVRTFAQFPK